MGRTLWGTYGDEINVDAIHHDGFDVLLGTKLGAIGMVQDHAFGLIGHTDSVFTVFLAGMNRPGFGALVLRSDNVGQAVDGVQRDGAKHTDAKQALGRQDRRNADFLGNGAVVRGSCMAIAMSEKSVYQTPAGSPLPGHPKSVGTIFKSPSTLSSL